MGASFKHRQNIYRAYMEFFWKGSTAPIKAVLESFVPNLDPDGIVTFSRWDVSLMDRDPDAAERALTSARLENFVAPTGVPLPKSYLVGCVALIRNDAARAQQEAQNLRSDSYTDPDQNEQDDGQVGFQIHVRCDAPSTRLLPEGQHPLGQNTKKCLVPTARLELAQLSPLPPQDSVSTNFTTSA